jgi:hypothetical protein
MCFASSHGHKSSCHQPTVLALGCRRAQLGVHATFAACVAQVVDPVAAAQPAARSKDLMRAMKEAAQGIGMRGGREVSSSSSQYSSSSLHAAGYPCGTMSW